MKRFNEGVARGEAALALAMLLLMIVVAFAQAFFRNMTNAGFAWANTALGWIDWADFILSKGTLWLAFLGASMAVQSDKHVAVDALPRLVSPKARIIMRGIVGIAGSIICFYLARAFWSAVLVNGLERPANAEILTPDGSVHVCDATPEQLAGSSAEPGFYCYLRALFRALGVQIESPGAAFELIVPVMFLFMCARMLGNGIYDFMLIARGEVHDDPAAHGLTGAASDVAHDIEDHRKER